MTPPTDAQTLTKTISLLGGPTLDPSDIKWAADLPAGRALLEWLAAQVRDWDREQTFGDKHVGDKEGRVEGEEMDVRMRAALRDVALEHEEVLILNHAKASQITLEGDDIPSQSAHYQPPSWQKKHAEYLNTDTELMQKETERLKTRLSQTKKAVTKMKQSIKTLQRVVEDAGTQNRKAEERLSELSITVDIGVMSTLGDAQDLLESLKFGQPVNPETAHELKHDPIEDPTIHSARTRLADAQNGLLALISRLREHGETFAQIRKQEVYKREDLQFEAERLRRAFGSTKAGTRGLVDERDFVRELKGICALLEREETAGGAKGGGVLLDLLRELEEPEESEDEDEDENDTFPSASIMDVDATLSRAWDMDQLLILSTHETALDDALVGLDAVLAPLEALHASLARVVACLREAEALLEVFGEELEDIDLDVASSAEAGGGTVEDEEGGERGDDDRSSKESWARIEASEKAWLQTLISTYSLRPLHPALPAIYAHSPLRTSPPFAYPPRVQGVEELARERAGELGEVVGRLEGEVRVFEGSGGSGGSGTGRRLRGFVERWCGA
ncbi:hypothetical protein B0H34DRAFT_857858 [Crassisporium funariophilum]|nr:hypothetical protein B0H34DRAFT_857858 [Crassisporium funariophilum]